MIVTQDELSCPISFQLMTDPVMADDGYTYQQHAIEAWINKCNQGQDQRISEAPFRRKCISYIADMYTAGETSRLKWLTPLSPFWAFIVEWQGGARSHHHSRAPRWGRLCGRISRSGHWYVVVTDAEV
jgi:hypothetical protein